MILPQAPAVGVLTAGPPVPPAAPGEQTRSPRPEDGGWGQPSASPPAPFCLPSRELGMADVKAMLNRDDRITSTEVITYFIRLRPVMCKRQRQGALFVWVTDVLHGLDVTLAVEVQKTSHVKWERRCMESVWWLSGLYWIGGFSHAGPPPEGMDWDCNAYVYLHEPCWADMTEVQDKDCLSMRLLVGPDWMSKTYPLKVVNENEEEAFAGGVYTVSFAEVRVPSRNGKKERRMVVMRGLEELRHYLQSKHDCGLRWTDGILYKLVGIHQRSTPKEYHRELMKRSWPLVHAPARAFSCAAVSAPVTPRVSIDGEMEEAAQILQAITAAPARTGTETDMEMEVVQEEDEQLLEKKSESDAETDEPVDEGSHAGATADAVWHLQLDRIRRLLPAVPAPKEVCISDDDRCPAAEQAMGAMNRFVFAAYNDGPIACGFVRKHFDRYAEMEDGFERWCGTYADRLFPHLNRLVEEGSRDALVELERALRVCCGIGAELAAFYAMSPERALAQLRLESA